MSNENPEELLSISNAITSEEERREHCRKIVWARLLRIRNSDCRNQRYLMDEFWNDCRKINSGGIWNLYMIMWSLMDELVIVTETYTIKDGYTKQQGVLQYTYVDYILIEEEISAYTAINDDDAKGDDIERFKGTTVTRRTYPEGKRPTKMEVEVREFDDRIEERTTPLHVERHPQMLNCDDPVVIKKITYKRDLFREETFRPIHDELLYSPFLPVWFKNKCNEAKEHYEILISRQ